MTPKHPTPKPRKTVGYDYYGQVYCRDCATASGIIHRDATIPLADAGTPCASCGQPLTRLSKAG